MFLGDEFAQQHHCLAEIRASTIHIDCWHHTMLTDVDAMAEYAQRIGATIFSFVSLSSTSILVRPSGIHTSHVNG